MKIVETKEGAILEVFVKLKSKEFKIVAEAGEIVVCCTEEPVKGKVNKELVKELSRLLRKRVKLVSGFTSRKKFLLVKGISKNEVETILFHRTVQP